MSDPESEVVVDDGWALFPHWLAIGKSISNLRTQCEVHRNWTQQPECREWTLPVTTMHLTNFQWSWSSLHNTHHSSLATWLWNQKFLFLPVKISVCHLIVLLSDSVSFLMLSLPYHVAIRPRQARNGASMNLRIKTLMFIKFKNVTIISPHHICAFVLFLIYVYQSWH